MLQSTIKLLEHILYALASAGIVASISLAFTAVILRYVFSYSLEWIEEGARYLALFSALLVAGPVLRNRGHVSLDLFTANLTGTNYQLHRLLVNAVALAVGVSVSIWGYGLLVQTYEIGLRTGSLQFPQWLPYSIVPLGMAVLVLFSLAEIVSALQALRTGKDPSLDGAPTGKPRDERAP